MNIFYHPSYNISLGFLDRFHPFDGSKFGKVHKEIKGLADITIKQPAEPVSTAIINEFADEQLQQQLTKKDYILQALEVPQMSFLPHSVIKNRILKPMRLAAAGTLAATRDALKGTNCWNMGGGYHHASPHESEGFCIYNDIGIAIQQLRKDGTVTNSDRFIILDIDAHHGNGNARTFGDDPNVDLFDIYNNEVYPQTPATKSKVDINIPLAHRTEGPTYLKELKAGLNKVKSGYRVAFVVAGTDVISIDPLGGLGLSIDDCIARDVMVLDRMMELEIPVVFTGGGGYSEGSAKCIAGSLKQVYKC